MQCNAMLKVRATAPDVVGFAPIEKRKRKKKQCGDFMDWNWYWIRLRVELFFAPFFSSVFARNPFAVYVCIYHVQYQII